MFKSRFLCPSLLCFVAIARRDRVPSMAVKELAVPFEVMPKAAKKRFGLLPADA
jgi:hypothetical protein